MITKIHKKLNKRSFYSTLSVLLLVIISEIFLTCYIPEWRNGFYTIMKEKHQELFLGAITSFFLLYTGLGIAQGVKVWVGQLVSFQARVAMSKITLKRAVKHESMSSLPAYSQAMTQAIQNSTELYLRVLVEIVISAAIVLGLIVVNLDQPIILSVAFLYTVGASLIAYLFQKPLTVTDKAWQETESHYREAIVTIANGKGDYTAKSKFLKLMGAYYHYIRTQMYFQLMSRLKGAIGSIIPYFLLGTAYFRGDMDFGQFMAGIATFELIVINATIFIIMYPDYVKAKASQLIVKEFMK